MRIALAAMALLILPLRPCAAEPFAGEFMTLGAGARAIGMGGAYAALADDASAAYWNPAGLAQLDRTQAAFMHSTLHGLDAYDYFNAAHRSGTAYGASHGCASALTILNSPQRRIRSRSARSTARRFGRKGLCRTTPSRLHGVRALLKRIGSPRMSVLPGSSFSYRRLEGNNAFGVGADAAALGVYRLSDGSQLRAAANLQDAAETKIYWNTPPKSGESSHRDVIGQNLKLGLALAHSVPPGENSSFTIAAELNSKYDYEKNFCAEWSLGNALALRLGLMERKSAAETLRDISAGAWLQAWVHRRAVVCSRLRFHERRDRREPPAVDCCRSINLRRAISTGQECALHPLQTRRARSGYRPPLRRFCLKTFPSPSPPAR